MRKILSGIAIALLTTVALAAPAAQASAIPPGPISQSPGHVTNVCPGHVIDSQRLYNYGSRKTVGWVYLYYSSANSGTNCVVVTNNTGKVTRVRAELRIKSDGNAKKGNSYKKYWDEGMYASYAGAVFATNTDGHCAQYTGKVWFPGGDSSVTTTAWKWCG